MLGGATPSRSVARPTWPPLDIHPPPAHLGSDVTGFGRYGLYSLFPAGDLYSSTPRYAHAQPVPPQLFHGLVPPPPHKECVFSAYTPGPGSPYSAPVVERGILQLHELMNKGVDKKSTPTTLETPHGTAERRPRRRAWDHAPAGPGCVEVKQEVRTNCPCIAKTPSVPTSGCSRTTPVTIRPQPHVKREPSSTPCQVAEVTTSAVKVKQELPDTVVATPVNATQGSIPVGIAVARQRAQEAPPRIKEDPLPLPPLASPLDHSLPIQPPGGYQLVRDPVSGQLLLISTGTNIGVSDPVQRAIVWPNNTTSFSSSPLLLPQAQPITGLVLDRLVTLSTPTSPPQPSHDKHRPPPGLLKIDDPSITGVMPCTKSSVVIQQLSTGTAPLINPHFSAITSSGSVVIQQISGTNTIQPTLIPQQNTGSVLISAQQLTAEAQSLINGQSMNSPSVVISHSHQQDTTAAVINPHVISQLSTTADILSSHPPLIPFLRQPEPQILQIKEPPKQEIIVTEAEGLKIEDHFTSCRSQATSPVACLSPPIDCQSQSEDEGPVPGVVVADASNQTDSLPPSSDEEAAAVEAEEPEPMERREAVDLSGLQLLSTASEQRSFRDPVIEVPKIKIEVLEDVPDEKQVPYVVPPSNGVTIKEEVELLEEKPQEPVRPKELVNNYLDQLACTTEMVVPAIRSGRFGMLCDVAHRLIEEEAAASRPHSPVDQGEKQTTDGPNNADLTGDDKSSYAESYSCKNSPFRTDSPCSPVDQSVRVTEMQKQYREKQRALACLTPRTSVSSETSTTSSSSCATKRGPGRPRKDLKKADYFGGEGGLSRGVKRPSSTSLSSPELSPPVLEPWSTEKCQPDSEISPPTLTPHKGNNKPEAVQQAQWETTLQSLFPPSLSPADSPSSASKKRKVGRPKKRVDHSSHTIVANKHRSKSSIVGLFLAKKHHLPTQATQTSAHKIKPKLKAEAKMKAHNEDEETEWASGSSVLPPYSSTPIKPSTTKSLPSTSTSKPPNKKPIMLLATRRRAVSTDQTSSKASNAPQPLYVRGVSDCQLTAEHLLPKNLPIRVLFLEKHEFKAGTVSAIHPPDVYGLLLDGERSHRPNVYSREEILKDTILEVCSETVPSPGSRVCAYWSQQSRSLYPGTVTLQFDDPIDPRFVHIEFDDGDSSKIVLENVRLLPQNFPVIVSEPNPLHSQAKRRRRNSAPSCESHSKPIQPVEPVMEHEELSETESPVASLGSEPSLLGHGDLMEMESSSVDEKEVTPLSQTSNSSVDEKEVTPSSQTSEEEQNTDQPKVKSFFDVMLPTNSPEQTAQTQPLPFNTESARERKRQKKKRKDKLRHSDSEKKRHHKHKDCSKSHKHKHKHRHRKHKHRRSSKSSAEGGSSEENPGQSWLVVHNQPAVASTSITVPTSPPIRSTIKLKETKGRVLKKGAGSRSKMANFLPERQLWRWADRGFKRGRARKDFHKSIKRGNEKISVTDCAVFLSTGRPDRPFVGRIEAMWETTSGSMYVKVKWFYHPEETVGCPDTLPYPGALFESTHRDENEVQTVSHKCEVISLEEFKKVNADPNRLATIYEYNDLYYLAGHYDPSNMTLRLQPGVITKQ